MTETALVITVPEADSLIGEYRRRHTRDGAAGMPAHVTLLYPFADVDALTDATSDEIAQVSRSFDAFDFVIRKTARFEGDLLWLRPDPSEPFVALTEALARAFPEFPPYGGVHDEIVPHVSVAHGDDALFAALEHELAPALPIRSAATEIELFEHVGGRWRRRAGFELNRHRAEANA